MPESLYRKKPHMIRRNGQWIYTLPNHKLPAYDHSAPNYDRQVNDDIIQVGKDAANVAARPHIRGMGFFAITKDGGYITNFAGGIGTATAMAGASTYLQRRILDVLDNADTIENEYDDDEPDDEGGDEEPEADK